MGIFQPRLSVASQEIAVMWTGRTFTALGAVIAVCAGAISLPAHSQDRGYGTFVPRDAFAARLLGAHNRERDNLGIPRLKWSARLAGDAQAWADHLAQTKTLEHAPSRNGAGENLWMGSAGYFSAEEMVGGFLDERRYFRPGKFPDTSTSGKWEDVGHYTQLIWPGTKEVGCAVAAGGGNDYLVCRYFPAGNLVGQEVP